MLLNYFNFEADPFPTVSDDCPYFMTLERRQALLLVMGSLFRREKNFLLVLGEEGTGKSKFITYVLNHPPRNVILSSVDAASSSTADIFAKLYSDLAIDTNKTPHNGDALAELQVCLIRLYAEKKFPTIIIDNADHLDDDALNQLTHLVQMKLGKIPVMHVILVGHPRLTERLSSERHAKLTASITGKVILAPFSDEQAADYVRHRLRFAAADPSVISDNAVAHILRRANGTPGDLHRYAKAALMKTMENKQTTVTASKPRRTPSITRPMIAGVMALSLVAFFGFKFFEHQENSPFALGTVDEISQSIASTPSNDNASQSITKPPITQELGAPVNMFVDISKPAQTLFALDTSIPAIQTGSSVQRTPISVAVQESTTPTEFDTDWRTDLPARQLAKRF